MEIVMGVILMVLLVAVVFCFFMLYRNQVVYDERSRLLCVISEIGKENIKVDKEWEHLYKNYNETPYNKMLWNLTRWHWDITDDGFIV